MVSVKELPHRDRNDLPYQNMIEFNRIESSKEYFFHH